jgi:AbrB family looped-hinge helix DNA binding protein
MKTTIDAAGSLVIPKEIRRRAGISAGMPLEVRWHDGRIEIEPILTPIRLERRGRFVVAASDSEIEELTAETVEDTRQALADERGGVSGS